MPYVGQGEGQYWVDDAPSAGGGRMGFDGNMYDAQGNMIRPSRPEPKPQVDPMAGVIGQQEQQWQESQDLFSPYIGMGEQGLAGMGSLMSGEYTPSSEMQYQQGLGEMALSNAYGAGGMGRSSAAQTGFSNMYADLLGEDVQRQYGDMFSMMGVGQGAVGQIGQAGNAYQQNMAQIYGQQGSQNAAAALAQGQSNANMWNTAGSALGGVTNYMMQNPSGGGGYSQPYTVNYQQNMGQMTA